MFSLRYWLELPLRFFTYIWLDVLVIRETPKAILIMFDGKKNWLPKAWILKIKRDKNGYTARIKISQYNWAKKSQ